MLGKLSIHELSAEGHAQASTQLELALARGLTMTLDRMRLLVRALETADIAMIQGDHDTAHATIAEMLDAHDIGLGTVDEPFFIEEQ